MSTRGSQDQGFLGIALSLLFCYFSYFLLCYFLYFLFCHYFFIFSLIFLIYQFSIQCLLEFLLIMSLSYSWKKHIILIFLFLSYQIFFLWKLYCFFNQRNRHSLFNFISLYCTHNFVKFLNLTLFHFFLSYSVLSL